ncbi:kelch repeat domain [Anaeramoeba flamelloides]|uniref:Kelch repeat domain n=1 Tax=Anaeramoeba flamelloides TaxID=1746091 RepID=A0ABQ8YUD7_9EUKA|nr:kelch repeat domain [Anaeramoeba flamelloides]
MSFPKHWKLMKKMVGAPLMASCATCVYQDHIYVHGGLEKAKIVSSQLQSYNPFLKTWKVHTIPNLPKKCSHAIVPYKNCLYLFGSFYEPFEMYEVNLEKKTCSVFEINQKGLDLCFPNIGVFGSSMIIFGGYSVTRGESNEMIEVDLEKKTNHKIVIKGNKPSPRTRCGCCSHGNKMWIYGGSSWDVHSDFWCYNHENSTWTEITTNGPTPGGRYFTKMCCDTSGENIYLFGGYNEVYFNDLWRFNFKTNLWEQIKTAKTQMVPFIPKPRRSHNMEYTYGQIFVLFGKIGDFSTNSSHKLRIENTFKKRFFYDHHLAENYIDLLKQQKLCDTWINLRSNEKIGFHKLLLFKGMFSKLGSKSKRKAINIISKYYSEIGNDKCSNSLYNLLLDHNDTNLTIKFTNNNNNNDDDDSLHFHKIVLAARSQYFEDLFIKSGLENQIIDEPFGLSLKSWKILKEWIYMGQINKILKRQIITEIEQNYKKFDFKSSGLDSYFKNLN